MNEQELIIKLADAMGKYFKPNIPLEIDLWDTTTIGQYLKPDPPVVRERIACLPDFLPAIRLPSSKERVHPLYKAVEVIRWSETYREKKR